MSSASDARFLVITLPAAENKRSEGIELAGTPK